MGQIQQPDATSAGDVRIRFMNTAGKGPADYYLEAGTTPKLILKTAGSGFQVLSAAGVVLLDVPETGFSISGSFVQLVPQAVAPTGITEGAIWYSSVDKAYHGVDDTGDVVLVSQ